MLLKYFGRGLHVYMHKYKLLLLSDELRFKPNYDHVRIFSETVENELGTYLKIAAKYFNKSNVGDVLII